MHSIFDHICCKYLCMPDNYLIVSLPYFLSLVFTGYIMYKISLFNVRVSQVHICVNVFGIVRVQITVR
jgi:hypothetical protein